ncbi:MAG: AAA family ATPase [Thermoprotei archaeon]|jgi:RecA/RadA recombinase
MTRLIDLIPEGKCTLIYGTGGTGKTTVALEAALNKALGGKTVVYAFSGPYSFISRGTEIARNMRAGDIPNNLVFVKAETLEDLRKVAALFLSKPPNYFVVDTATHGYRTLISTGKRAMEAGRSLTEIIGLMLASKPSEGALMIADAQMKPVGEERPSAEGPLKFWCDACIHLVKLPDGTRKALENNREITFKIGSGGTEVI